MNFGTAIKTCFSKYAVFSGRASRSEYWFFALFGILGGIVAIIIDVMILGHSLDNEYTPINSIFSLVLIIPSIAVTCRRLHDVNKSGWWILLPFTIIGIIPLIIWNVSKGTEGKNRFGEYPLKLKRK